MGRDSNEPTNERTGADTPVLKEQSLRIECTYLNLVQESKVPTVLRHPVRLPHFLLLVVIVGGRMRGLWVEMRLCLWILMRIVVRIVSYICLPTYLP